MKTNTSEKIKQYLRENKFASAKSLTDFTKLSQRAMFKQLKNLLDQGLVGKMGQAPKVFYYLASTKKEIDIPYQSEWLILEKEDYANYLFVAAAWEGYTVMAKNWGFINGNFLSAEYINRSCNLFASKLEYQKMNNIHFSMLFNNPKAWDRLHRITFNNSKRMFAWAQSKLSLNEKKLSDKKLVDIIERFNQLQKDVHCPRGPMWCLETPSNLVSDYLRNYLEEQAREVGKTKTKPYLAFQSLSASLSNSIWTEEELALIKICKIVDKKKRLKKLEEHARQYDWLEYGLEGKKMSLKDFTERMNKILKKNPDILARKLAKEKKDLARSQEKIIREYKIDEKHQKIFAIVRDSVAARLYSKDSQFFGYYALEKILEEFGRRTGLNLEQVRFLAPREFRLALLENQDFSTLTKARMEYSLHVSNEGNTVFFQGEQAKKVKKKMNFNLHQDDLKESKLVSGQPAYPGIVRGRVKIVNTINEIFKVHQGNILVSRMTNPSILPAMKKAVAIVTDIGGITCHAAIVARELRKPCIIGTKVATQIFKDGDEIEVDANEGRVYLLD